MRSIDKTTIANIILSGEMLKTFLLIQECPLSTFLQNNVEALANKARKINLKKCKIGKEKVKLSLLVDNMIMYTENPKVYTDWQGS